MAFRRTTVQWKFYYKLCFHWLKHLQKDKIYVVLSCVGRKQKDLELNTCFLCRYLHVSITEIHDNFREPYQYKYLRICNNDVPMYTNGIIVQR